MMKVLITLTLGIVLSAGLAAAAIAAPAADRADPGHRKGLKTSKKTMASLHERDRKMREVRKQAHARRKQAQAGK